MRRMEKMMLGYWTNVYIPIRQQLLIRGHGELSRKMRTESDLYHTSRSNVHFHFHDYILGISWDEPPISYIK